jgi:hypothetical protein
MNKNNVYADKYGIHITTPQGNDYAIGWWQIEQDGFTSWLNHLQDKSWFTEDMKQKFTDLCFEKCNWN